MVFNVPNDYCYFTESLCFMFGYRMIFLILDKDNKLFGGEIFLFVYLEINLRGVLADTKYRIQMLTVLRKEINGKGERTDYLNI